VRRTASGFRRSAAGIKPVDSAYELQLSVPRNRLDLAIGAFHLRINGLIQKFRDTLRDYLS
jgi:hypothetical protein